MRKVGRNRNQLSCELKEKVFYKKIQTLFSCIILRSVCMYVHIRVGWRIYYHLPLLLYVGKEDPEPRPRFFPKDKVGRELEEGMNE